MTMYAWMIEKQDELIKKWNTRNPFEIAEFLEIAIFFEDLGNMYGYYNMKNRIKMI
ncbi:toxin, partial [Listeria monocytogenes]|nr:toxin [Listeria monocytogenes]